MDLNSSRIIPDALGSSEGFRFCPFPLLPGYVLAYYPENSGVHSFQALPWGSLENMVQEFSPTPLRVGVPLELGLAGVVPEGSP